MEEVLVLYSDVDEEYELTSSLGPDAALPPAPNAFYFSHTPKLPVRLIHLHRNFPLRHLEGAANFVFRVQDKQGAFHDLDNPATLVPRHGPEGGIILKVFRSPNPIHPPDEEVIKRTLEEPIPHTYWEYVKFQKPSRGSSASALDSLSESVAQFDFEATTAAASDAVKDGAKTLKQMGRKLSTQLQGLDEEKIKKQGAKLMGGMKSLFNKVKEATETVIQEVNSSGSMQIGRYKVRMGEMLAEGGFSMVYMARDEGNDSKYAVKKMICQTKEGLKDAQTEVKLLRAMDHPNIIPLMGHKVVDADRAKHYFLLFEYIPKTAYDIMAANITKSPHYEYSNVNSYASPFTEVQALECMLGCCEALAYMHNKLRVCHRDFKPHNVLLKDNGGGFMGGPMPVVMDVGSVGPLIVEVKTRGEALNLEEDAVSKCSAPYRCPELTAVNVGTTVDGGSDMWSVGCSLFALAFGYCCFETPKEGVMKLGILGGRWSFPRNDCVNQFSEGYRSLIGKLLQVDSNDRGSARDCADEIKRLLSR